MKKILAIIAFTTAFIVFTNESKAQATLSKKLVDKKTRVNSANGDDSNQNVQSRTYTLSEKGIILEPIVPNTLKLTEKDIVGLTPDEIILKQGKIKRTNIKN